MLNIYCLYDKKANQFGQPTYFPNKAVAFRYYDNMLDNPQNAYMRCDLDLYYLGDYNCDTGVITTYGKPEFISSMNLDGGSNE